MWKSKRSPYVCCTCFKMKWNFFDNCFNIQTWFILRVSKFNVVLMLTISVIQISVVRVIVIETSRMRTCSNPCESWRDETLPKAQQQRQVRTIYLNNLQLCNYSQVFCCRYPHPENAFPILSSLRWELVRVSCYLADANISKISMGENGRNTLWVVVLWAYYILVTNKTASAVHPKNRRTLSCQVSNTLRI